MITSPYFEWFINNHSIRKFIFQTHYYINSKINYDLIKLDQLMSSFSQSKSIKIDSYDVLKSIRNF
jgi:hypothetical protein